MSLITFLYRCPECGHDPLDGSRDTATCGGCGARIERTRGGRITVDGRVRRPAELAAAIEAFGGPMTAATSADGSLRYTADVEATRGTGMEVIPGRGEVLGFVEGWSTPVPGALTVTDAVLTFRPAGSGSEEPLALLDVAAIQTSSSALQLNTSRGLVQYRFVGDSVRRWEALLQTLVQRAWSREGRGDVVEFQPRIVARR